MKPLDLRLPMCEAPYEQQDLPTEAFWQPYPKAGPRVAFSPRSINNERFRLYTIMADALPVVLTGNPQDSPFPGQAILHSDAKMERLQDIESRLLAWYESLHPQAVYEPDSPSDPAVPLIDLQ